ncbi:MAG: polysaccharide deacetylase family sporulation protein PdaB, partial [Syntrophomonadaceae bacterium]|nr:polysaccharide deacetylase family sporulation protein PdaB [Syntrophomonadaceae bacterium]
MPKIFGFYQIKKGGKALVAGLIVMALMCGSAVYVNATAKLKPIYEVETDEKVVALTFDISWGNVTPLPVIDILKEQGVRSTMFLSGPWVKQYPEIPQRLVEDGHEIASHGYRHINLSELGAAEIQEEVQKAHNNIKEVTGVEPNLIRTPNGDYNDVVVKAIRDMGYEVIQWSVDSLDWMNPGVDTIIERVTQKVHPGAIILMHASDTCKQTAEALPAVIQSLKEQG